MKFIMLALLIGTGNWVTAQALPAWITNRPEFANRTVKEWAEFDTAVRYRDIVKMHGITTFFGIKGDATKGGVCVVMTDPCVLESNSLIYGAYSDSYSLGNHATPWDMVAQDFSSWWDGYRYMIPSTSYRKRAYIVENQDNLLEERIVFKAWSFVKVDIKIIVVTFGDSRIADFEYALPGIYRDAFNGGYLTAADFKTIYEYNGRVTWKNTDYAMESPVMRLEDNGELEINGNQYKGPGDYSPPDIVMDVWGKMLTYNAGGTAPVIDPTYEYGLWVAGEMVSEDFIMQPKDNWADHVFDTCHQLPDLNVLESYIKEHGHLPGIPSAADIKKGYQQHDINRQFLEKIEELTLYKIGQQQQTKSNQGILDEQTKRINELRKRLSGSTNSSIETGVIRPAGKRN
ncbi:MAG: hypothetical protein V4722_04800 [Bacteroidota bacterium]